MKNLISILFAALLSACGGSSNQGSNSSAPPVSPPGPGTSWSMNYGRPPGAVTMQPGDWFDFPVCQLAPAPEDPSKLSLPCSVNYVERPWVPLIGKQSVTLKYEITGTDPVFSFQTNPNNVCPGDASLSLLLHRAGDNLSFQYHRWFSQSSAKKLQLGRFEYAVPLQMSSWTPVYPPGIQTLFDQALAEIATIGFVLGGGCFAGHGVALTGGSARWQGEISSQ
jgi:hypothetical protein